MSMSQYPDDWDSLERLSFGGLLAMCFCIFVVLPVIEFLGWVKNKLSKGIDTRQLW